MYRHSIYNIYIICIAKFLFIYTNDDTVDPPEAPMGPSWPVDETRTLDSITLGSIHICVSWFRDTRVQLVTAPPT